MKKLLTLFICLFAFTTFVYAEDYLTTITTDNTKVKLGETVYVDVLLSDIDETVFGENDKLDTIIIGLAYDKNVFEISTTPVEATSTKPAEFKVLTNWETDITDEDRNADFTTLLDPSTDHQPGTGMITTGIYIPLGTTEDSAKLGVNSLTTAKPTITLIENVPFKVKANATPGTYKISVHPMIDDHELVYNGVITVTVSVDPLHSCIIDAYNTKNSANKGKGETLTDAEYATITSLTCKNIEFDTEKLEDLTEVEKLTNLEELSLGTTYVDTLNFKKNPKLKKLNLGVLKDNTTITLKDNILLEELSIIAGSGVEDKTLTGTVGAIDVTKNTKLKKLFLNIGAKTLDLTKNTDLEELITYCPLTTLDLTKNTKLTMLSVRGGTFSSLDLSKNTLLSFDTLNAGLKGLVKNVNVEINKDTEIPHIVNLPSEVRITKTVPHDGTNTKITGTKLKSTKLGADTITIDYYFDETHFFTETIKLNVVKSLVNPPTGVFDVTAFLVIIGLLSFMLYRSIKNRESISLQ